MLIKPAGNDGKLWAFKKMRSSKWNKGLIQKDFDLVIDYNNNNDGDDGTIGEEVEESFERNPVNLEENLEARLPNAP